jgi:hypothetical protein
MKLILDETPIYWAKILVVSSFLNFIIYAFTGVAFWVAMPVLKLPIIYWLLHKTEEGNGIQRSDYGIQEDQGQGSS